MLNSSHEGKFLDAHSFQKAFLTDMIDELVQTNEVVNPIFIDGVWFEIDTIEDLENVREKNQLIILSFFLALSLYQTTLLLQK